MLSLEQNGPPPLFHISRKHPDIPRQILKFLILFEKGKTKYFLLCANGC